VAKSAVAEQSSTPSTARWKTISFLALRIAFALLLVAAGGAKLAGNAQMVQLFDAIGIGQWFRIFTGICELLTAILLLFPATIGIGALLGFWRDGRRHYRQYLHSAPRLHPFLDTSDHLGAHGLDTSQPALEIGSVRRSQFLIDRRHSNMWAAEGPRLVCMFG
jgi:hypothetical protein